MKKHMIAIAVCSLLMLTACNKSTETVTGTAETTVAAVSSETTTAEIIAETSAAPAETTIAETTAQSEEKTLSAEELEKQIAAAEELLEKMKEEEAAQTADVEYEKIDILRGFYVEVDDEGWTLSGIEGDYYYGATWDDFGAGKEWPMPRYCEMSYAEEDSKPYCSSQYYITQETGIEITLNFIYDKEILRDKFGYICETNSITFETWNPEEKGYYLYWVNGEPHYSFEYDFENAWE